MSDKEEQRLLEENQKLRNKLTETINELDGQRNENARLKMELEQFKQELKDELKAARKEMEEKIDETKKRVKVDKEINEAIGKTSTPSAEKGFWELRNGDGKKKKKTSKNRRHERRIQARLSKSVDSLYTNSNESESETGVDSNETGSDAEVGGKKKIERSLLVREVPKISKFDVHGSRDIGDFFKEYERYCKDKFGDNMRFWVKELGEYLQGRIGEFYRTIISVGDQKYDILKERIVGQVKRVKTGVKYRKKSGFDDAKIGRNEDVDIYAHRLETLARKKYGNEGINENKDLMKKFLATVPNNVVECVNMKRKEKQRWKNERLLWEDVLEIIEDGELAVGNNDRKEVYAGSSRKEVEFPEYKTYKEALMANPVEIMAKFLDDYYGNSEGKGIFMGNERQSNVKSNGRNFGQNQTQNGGNNVGNQNVTCYYCNKRGHVKRDCRWFLGTCLACGMNDHTISNCPTLKSVKCFKCGRTGHRANRCRASTGSGVCGNCGQPGHFARMCQSPWNVCGNCGVSGHATALCRNVNYMNQTVYGQVQGAAGIAYPQVNGVAKTAMVGQQNMGMNVDQGLNMATPRLGEVNMANGNQGNGV